MGRIPGLAMLVAFSAVSTADDRAATKSPEKPPARAGNAAPSKKKTDDEPKVLTAQETANYRRTSTDGDYGQVEWNDLPAWRKTSFFGIRAKGQTFVYVVDCSGSMGDANRLLIAKRELRRAIGSLAFPQRFQVIFYNDRPIPMPGGLPKPAATDSTRRLVEWLRLIEPDGETDPRGAMALALAQKPDAVFLLSDGAFPDGSADSILKGNRNRVPIHCIDLSAGAGGDQLKRIAAGSGGSFVSR